MLSVMDVMTFSNTLLWLAVSLSVRSRMYTHTLRSMSKLHSMICSSSNDSTVHVASDTAPSVNVCQRRASNMLDSLRHCQRQAQHDLVRYWTLNKRHLTLLLIQLGCTSPAAAELPHETGLHTLASNCKGSSPSGNSTLCSGNPQAAQTHNTHRWRPLEISSADGFAFASPFTPSVWPPTVPVNQSGQLCLCTSTPCDA
jgi:hypothetical protein